MTTSTLPQLNARVPSPAAPCSALDRLSPRTGKPVRRYDDSISTTVRALDFDERAIRKLVTKWPQGARCGDGLEPWPKRLAAILVQVLNECGPYSPLLGYTPPELRDTPNAKLTDSAATGAHEPK